LPERGLAHRDKEGSVMRRLNPIEKRVERFLREPPSVRNAAAVIVVATTVVVVGAGVLINLIDGEEYPDIGVGMWWALQTVTTVGYGDVAPTQDAGRLLGAVVMLEGTAFIAIVTAVITSTFVARATRDYEASRAADETSDQARLDRRFDELERKLDLLVTARENPRA
jgi:voltage-gated potassium channel Kch